MRTLIKYILTLSILVPLFCHSQPIVITDKGILDNFGDQVEIIIDENDNFTLDQILSSSEFEKQHDKVLNLGISTNTYWIKIPISNRTEIENLYLDIKQPSIDEVTFYFPSENGYSAKEESDSKPLNTRSFENQNYIFPLNLKKDESKTYYLKLKSGDHLMVPMSIAPKEIIIERNTSKDIYFGIFTGIMLALFLYSIITYLNLRDKSYALYVLYVFVMYLNQANVLGYSLRFFWPEMPNLERGSVYLFIPLSGIVGILFLIKFIQIKRYSQFLLYPLVISMGAYVVAIISGITGYHNFAYNIIEINGSSIAIYIIAISFIIWRKGNRQAGSLLLAWSIFLFGLVAFILKDLNVLEHNDFTVYTITIGTAAQGILLSFGLADKINILKKEKEEAQKREIEALRVNEKELEARVIARTLELEQAEQKATKAYHELIVSQKQLVESEKLAGLGQMTAGIAHELNNPINFVSSNVGPLQRDVEDVIQILDEFAGLPPDTNSEEWKEVRRRYDKMQIPYVKKEIEMLLKGIEEGSQRTAEIVKGMRIFARADKDTLVPANINDCINSTLVVMKSVLKNEVTLKRSIDMNIPVLDCYPGKLNQAIVNLVSNAVQATKVNRKSVEDRIVEVKSYFDDNNLFISVKDNGPGISDEILNKIFDPFFTTKQVGEGTGLGLSIAMGIAEEHNGHIEVITEVGKGSEFIIHLPRKQKFGTRTAA